MGIPLDGLPTTFRRQALTTLLTGMFACRVALLMSPPVDALVWGMATATATGGLWALFFN
jgi:hypothetical protein